MGRAVEMLANPYMAAAAGAAALGAAIAKTTKMANRWQEAMAEINVTAELSKEKLKGLSDELLAIGSRNAAPLEEVPKAFNCLMKFSLKSCTASNPTISGSCFICPCIFSIWRTIFKKDFWFTLLFI